MLKYLSEYYPCWIVKNTLNHSKVYAMKNVVIAIMGVKKTINIVLTRGHIPKCGYYHYLVKSSDSGAISLFLSYYSVDLVQIRY